jgi:vacuolar-type H+-ATPase subunit E/Vma4
MRGSRRGGVEMATRKLSESEKEKLKAEALEEYEKIIKPAYLEYEKIQKPAYAKYDKRCREINKM